MFDVLRETSDLHLVISGVYYAFRLMKHRDRDPKTMGAFIVPGLKSEPSVDAQALAWAMVQEIEAKEGVPLARAEASHIEKYHREIADIYDQKLREKYPPNPEATAKAEAMLELWRRTPIHNIPVGPHPRARRVKPKRNRSVPFWHEKWVGLRR